MGYYNNQTYYDILGLPKYGKRDNGEQVSLESIINAKNRLKFGDPDDRVPFSMWNKIDEAYRVLSNVEERRMYDAKLQQEKSNSELYSEESNLEVPVTEKNNEETIEETIEEKNSVLNENTAIEDQEIEIPNINNDIPMVSVTEEDFLVENEESTYDLIKPKLKKVGKEIVLALPTAVLATVNIVKKLNERKKYNVVEENTEKTITDVKTPETQLIENYREELNLKINKTLNQYHTNYDLMIDKIRYENYIELLKKRIELKENEVVKRGKLTIYKLQLTSLRNQLISFEKCLEEVKNKIETNKKEQKLFKINDQLIDVEFKIMENNNSSKNRIINLKKLEIRKDNLLNKRNLKIQKMKSRREIYAIFKDSFISEHSKVENFVDNVFVPIDKIDEKFDEKIR